MPSTVQDYRNVSRAIAILLLLVSLTFFSGLGRQAIADSDEAFYAESAREMLEREDWLTPYFNYQVRFQKPILFYWMVSSTYLVAGISAAAARFPSALAGLGLTLITYLCARRRYGNHTGGLAGAIIATSFGYAAMAHQSLPDLPLAFFITLAIWAGLEGLAPATPDTSSNHRRWLLLASSAAACAFLTKGPVGLVVPLLSISLIFLLYLLGKPNEAWAELRQRVTFTNSILCVGIFFLIVTPWFFAMWQEHGWSYLSRFFITENLERFATTRYNEPRGLWFYPAIILTGLLPWSPFMFLWIRPLLRFFRGQRRFTEIELQFVIWSTSILLFFTASIGKQPRYILPILPPLAILLARTIDERLKRLASTKTYDWLFTASGVLAAGMTIALGIILTRAKPLIEIINPLGSDLAPVLIIGSGLGLIFSSFICKGRLIPYATILTSTITLLSFHYFVLSSTQPEPVQQLVQSVNENRHDQETVGSHSVMVRNLSFHMRGPIKDLSSEQDLTSFMRSSDRVLCVINEKQLELLRTSLETPPKKLAEFLYLNQAALKIGMLLWPKPDDDITTVVLVTNR